MTVKTFFYGLAASFAIPWLIMVVIPYGSMSSMANPEYDENKDEKTGTFQPLHSGRVGSGSLIYAQEGCTMCHSQLTRPTYAGNDVFRDGQGGFKADPERGDTRRITNYMDFEGEAMANIGETRMGPDLGNFGSRVAFKAFEADTELAKELGVDVSELGDKSFNKELYVYQHLFDPRMFIVNAKKSNCPKNLRFFDKKKVYGQGAPDAVYVKDGYQYVPNDRGRIVANYLLNLKRDGDVPVSMIYNKAKLLKPAAAKKEAKQ